MTRWAHSTRSSPEFDFWQRLVPQSVASAQVVWERHREVARMRAVGLRWREIAARLGVSLRHVMQMSRLYSRHPESPVEKYCAMPMMGPAE